ncbi:MAG: MliC family protein [Patescibacteria group bacterium]|nr:MliC family protein [Patescibacteria group bacterium]MDE2116272.1 MliC family protein [Patescibacteria group bacterium]
MKKTTIASVVIVAIAILAIIAFVSRSGLDNDTTGTISYFCGAKQIDAAFDDKAATAQLSDGRSFTLLETMSADGARYEATSTGSNGAKTDIVLWTKGDSALLTENGRPTYMNCVAGAIAAASATTTRFTDFAQSYSFAYPSGLPLSGGDGSYSVDWRQGATSSGMLLAEVVMPGSFEPQTNFVDSRFTVGASSDPSAVATCLTSGNGDPTTTFGQTTIDGVSFAELGFGDAGAGNFYKTTSYRTVHNGECYAVEYTIHSSNIANFPPSRGISAFDQQKVASVMDSIVHSFQFAK